MGSWWFICVNFKHHTYSQCKPKKCQLKTKTVYKIWDRITNCFYQKNVIQFLVQLYHRKKAVAFRAGTFWSWTESKTDCKLSTGRTGRPETGSARGSTWRRFGRLSVRRRAFEWKVGEAKARLTSARFLSSLGWDGSKIGWLVKLGGRLRCRS